VCALSLYVSVCVCVCDANLVKKWSADMANWEMDKGRSTHWGVS